MPLDRTKPYAEVYGLLGVAFEQNGVYFKGNGQVAVDPRSAFVEPDPIDHSSDNDIIRPATEMPTEPPKGKGMDQMDDKSLRTLLEAYGGEWTSRKDAIKFLRGKAA